MAFGDIIQQKVVGTITGSSSYSVTFDSTATAGSLLIALAAVDKNAGSIATPSGWTKVAERYGTSVSGAIFYKLSDGTETGFSTSWSTGGLNPSFSFAEVEGPWPASPLASFSINNSAETQPTSLSTGTASAPSVTPAFAFALWWNDSGNPITGTQTVTNGFAVSLQYNNDNGANGNPATVHATKVVSAAASQETTFGNTDDQQIAAMLVFDGDSSGATVPDDPSDLSITATSDTEATATWTDNSDDENSFELQISTASDFSSVAQTLTPGANATSASITGLTASTDYYGRIRATNAAGDSGWSSTATFTTDDPPPASLLDVQTGAVTATTARVRPRFDGAGTVALEYSTDSGFATSTTTATQAIDSSTDFTGDFNLTGLTKATQYYFRFVVDGVTGASAGQFRTFKVGEAWNFTIVAAGDANWDSYADTYERMQAHDPDLFIGLGDVPYLDITTNDISQFRSEYGSWLTRTEVGSIMAAVPYVWLWDDHDFGTNDVGASAPSAPAAQSFYRERSPHYALNDSSAIYQSWTIGRVRFILTDLRSERSGSTFLSPAQMQWFKDEVTAAASDSSIRAVVWLNSVPWISSAKIDTWSDASAQRTEIANHVASEGMADKFIIWSADMHAVALDDGTNSVGGFPVWHMAPINRVNSVKGGPYTDGPYDDFNYQYGKLDVTDDGADLTITGTFYRSNGAGGDVQLTSATFTVPGEADPITGTLAAQETGSDTASISGAVAVTGTLAAQETGSDTFAASGTTENARTGTLAAQEEGSDTASMSGTVSITGTLAAHETGQDRFRAYETPPDPRRAISRTISPIRIGF